MFSTPVEIRFSNDKQYLPMALAFVRELAILAALPEKKAKSLELACEEAILNTIQHAFEPGEKGQICVQGLMDRTDLYVSIKDNGLPFDASLSPQFVKPAVENIDDAQISGLGIHLIQHMVDDVCWMNHGREGKELRLTVHLPSADISQQLPQEDLSPYDEEVPLAPEQEYTIRRLRPEDAIRVSQCIYRTYGNTYPNEDLYYPERIIQQNETGELISAVTLDERGEIVGHYALERPGLGITAESGQAIVIPSHRGRKLMERMRSFLEEEGKKQGLVGIFGQPVCKHTFSQRVNERFGSKPCGFNAALAPSTFSFKKMRADEKECRGSCMLYWRHLVEPEERIIHPPSRHEGILKQIYDYLNIPVRLEKPGTLPDTGSITLMYIKDWGDGFIRIESPGKSALVELGRALHDLIHMAGIETVYLEIPLAHPGAAECCVEAENKGFFFCGLGPHFFPESDALRMVYLSKDIAWDQLQIFNPFGQSIVDYAHREYKRVAK